MCFYQNIHECYHYDLLSLHASERESHKCRRVFRGESAGGGVKCALHTCCRFSREVIVPCGHAAELGGKQELGQEQLCAGDSFGEDVFVPFGGDESGRPGLWLGFEYGAFEGEGEGEEGAEARATPKEVIWDCDCDTDDADAASSAGSAVSMDFWPEDEPGKTVRVFLDDPVEGGDEKPGRPSRAWGWGFSAWVSRFW
ncbi:Uu.00g025850.m01.CDS01 [Anthostomella pinea]|uniref:Uu.00g025850.m01.CDS01 n=1 Tax=Anthostomella pinea TaxID=933095 RepID=A0AAI8V7Y0_9PEZI|nr:Uu.00g025850.m01.CDS01 [Anthostomella pinea]